MPTPPTLIDFPGIGVIPDPAFAHSPRLNVRDYAASDVSGCRRTDAPASCPVSPSHTPNLATRQD